MQAYIDNILGQSKKKREKKERKRELKPNRPYGCRIKRKCETHRRTRGGSLVTQVEAAVKVDISVVSMEQEEQGRETSLEGRAALIHCHLTTVGRTPGEKKGCVVP